MASFWLMLFTVWLTVFQASRYVSMHLARQAYMLEGAGHGRRTSSERSSFTPGFLMHLLVHLSPSAYR